MSKFDKIIPKGSVPNCQLQIANRYDNRWFKCKLKPPKNDRAPTHDYKLHQDVMYLEPITKKWYPAKIVRLLDSKRSYMIKTTEGAEYRKTQQHLKPYKPRKVCGPPRCKKDVNPGQDRPKRSTRPPDKLDL